MTETEEEKTQRETYIRNKTEGKSNRGRIIYTENPTEGELYRRRVIQSENHTFREPYREDPYKTRTRNKRTSNGGKGITRFNTHPICQRLPQKTYFVFFSVE